MLKYINSNMTHTSFGLFLHETFNVKIKENSHDEFKYFKEIGYADYRVGCDLCEYGQACGLKTNICQYIDTKEFKLNDLEIDFNNAWYNDDGETLTLQTMYETKDKEIIEQLYNYYIQFKKTEEQIGNIIICPTDYVEAGGHCITSCFWECPDTGNNYEEHISKDKLANITSAHLCLNCYKWFILMHKNKAPESFVKQNPLKYFWTSFVTDYLHDLIEFESPIIEDKFYSWCD